ncbi:MAG TPA: hypothetical protein PLV73_08690 [Treponemataceae bacterium]|jgi:hypothetical protein|nr:MAG: hypothetical protein BWY20_00834 [Spirochaetes bacterium ADurb.Bin215]HOF85985.1 hypothetical protein [Treponemataceae bacterium]HOS35360.1 hypothetical protein [Treponemataceae bacterium]HPA10884.1 hypothetical protein [Treponemataceae bacterium]HPL91227.1 hypothetical protein [Treponemataceae bacterium]
MTSTQWGAFSRFRTEFRTHCDRWLEAAGGNDGWLAALQTEAAAADGTPDYPVETPIVYNTVLDTLRQTDDIRLILVGDNPGKNEQLAKNRRYLVGQAGKLGEGFFRKNPDLGIDFRKHVIILNKSPVHTAKTKQLARLLREGPAEFAALFDETQRWMARETAALQQALGCPLWLVGYGELREKGLFSVYAKELAAAAQHPATVAHPGRATSTNATAQHPATVGHPAGKLYSPPVYLFQHFSMNRFSIDLRSRSDPGKSLAENLAIIGKEHRKEILGW